MTENQKRWIKFHDPDKKTTIYVMSDMIVGVVEDVAEGTRLLCGGSHTIKVGNVTADEVMASLGVQHIPE